MKICFCVFWILLWSVMVVFVLVGSCSGEVSAVPSAYGELMKYTIGETDVYKFDPMTDNNTKELVKERQEFWKNFVSEHKEKLKSEFDKNIVCKSVVVRVLVKFVGENEGVCEYKCGVTVAIVSYINEKKVDILPLYIVDLCLFKNEKLVTIIRQK
ncbi:MAG: hypothetical protein ACOC56_00275 [Atribacterota bacterium]